MSVPGEYFYWYEGTAGVVVYVRQQGASIPIEAFFFRPACNIDLWSMLTDDRAADLTGSAESRLWGIVLHRAALPESSRLRL